MPVPVINIKGTRSMTSNNVDALKLYVARVLAALYKATPEPIYIDASTALGSEQGSETEDKAATGAIVWLSRNGFVTGSLEQECAIPDAQLSLSALRVMEKDHPDMPRYSVGEQVWRALESDTSSSKRSVDAFWKLLLGLRA
jgi:hypothetical protein